MRWTHGLLLLCFTGACSVNDSVALLPEPHAQSDAGYCVSGAEPRLVADRTTGAELCNGQLAARVFQQSLCTCGDLVISASSATDAFASSRESGPTGGAGSIVGINGGLQMTSSLEIGGSLRVGGSGIQMGAGKLSVREELRDLGGLKGAASVQVGADAWVGGDIELQELGVEGLLTLPPERTLAVAQPPPRVLRATVGPFPPPCACATPENIGGYVKNHATAHHNASIGLAVDALADYSGAASLELPCGRFYLSRIHGAGSLLVRVTGRAALFVAGDVDVGALEVRLEQGAQLDLFVAGGLFARGSVRMGSPRYPAHLRVYVEGEFDLDAGDPWNSLPETHELAGNFYLPNTFVTLSRRAEVFGSLFAQRVAASAGLFLHQDLEVKDLGRNCS
ncbi:MAG: hypothetical protein ABW123_20605, partial [Cystobacter sp.]